MAIAFRKIHSKLVTIYIYIYKNCLKFGYYMNLEVVPC